MRSGSLLSVLLTLACGGAAQMPPAAASPPAPAARAAEPSPSAADASATADTFPTPYTAEQIRAATRPGRSYAWRVEAADAPVIEREITFGQVDASGAELSSHGQTRRVTWDELRRHAEFPRDAVTTREETISVPAGTFDCIVYVVNGASAGEVSTFYFAKGMPGAPVLFFVDKGGARTSTTTLIRYAPGAGAPVDATPSRP